MLEHRLVMEKKLGRQLEPNEVVHHLNENTEDNRPENLHLYPSNAEHKRDDIVFRKRDKLGRLLKKEPRAVASSPETKVEIFNEDCITGMERRIADGAVHLIVTSIPFE